MAKLQTVTINGNLYIGSDEEHRSYSELRIQGKTVPLIYFYSCYDQYDRLSPVTTLRFANSNGNLAIWTY